MNGDVWLGPNAVLAFRREGYKLLQINVSEFVDAVSFRYVVSSSVCVGVFFRFAFAVSCLSLLVVWRHGGGVEQWLTTLVGLAKLINIVCS